MNIIKQIFETPDTPSGKKRLNNLITRLGLGKKIKGDLMKDVVSGELGGGASDLSNYINDVYDYYCLYKIIGLAEDGIGNIAYGDLIVERINYTEDDLNSIKNLRNLIINYNSTNGNQLLYDNVITEVSFQAYNYDVFINKIPDSNRLYEIFYVKCRKVNKNSVNASIPDEYVNLLPEYASLVDFNNLVDGKTPLLKITAEDYYKGQYYISKSKIINQER